MDGFEIEKNATTNFPHHITTIVQPNRSDFSREKELSMSRSRSHVTKSVNTVSRFKTATSPMEGCDAAFGSWLQRFLPIREKRRRETRKIMCDKVKEGEGNRSSSICLLVDCFVSRG
jgi:hypothetical protein